MDADVFISVDIKKIGDHLSILQNELRETTIIIEILKTLYQTTDNPNVIMNQLQFMQNEKMCIKKKINVLEDSVNKFLRTKTDVNNTLDEAVEVLKYHKH